MVMSDIEGKVRRVGASERGERTSFKYEVKAKLAIAHLIFVRRRYPKPVLARTLSRTCIQI
jgi:hypothetical protein